MKTIFKYKKRIFYAILVVMWMIVIFGFSSQNGEESQGTSDKITDRIVNVIMQNFENYDYEDLKDTVSFIVRKLAHFTAYFIGGILIFGFFSTFDLKMKNIILLTVIFGALYAISDEVHQFFVAERAAQVRDVFIDSFGVVVATIIRSTIVKRAVGKSR